MYEKQGTSTLNSLEEKVRSRKENAQTHKEAQEQKSVKGTFAFYYTYTAIVVILLVAIAVLIIPLRNWLVSYEAAQPDSMRQQIYDSYFAQPEWDKLYELAGMEDNPFEGKDAFIACMTAKLDAATDPTLVCQETSAGLSGNRKYLIKLDGEKIATFILEPEEDAGEVTGWKLGSMEFHIAREYSVTIEKLPGQTVLINGVALDDSYTIRTIKTKAETYLPDGLHGFQCEQQQVTGLLAEPEVVLMDSNGQALKLVTDPETGILKGADQTGTMSITEAHKTAAIDAAKNYALFAIRKITSYTLSQYFDTNSELYKGAVNSLAFLKKIESYTFRDDLTVTDYYRYSDDFFSARVSLTMDIVTANGYATKYDSNMTYFFRKNSNGKFMVVDGTNTSVAERVEQVRLQFVNGTTILESVMVDASAATVTPPAVEVPEGQVFKGWALKSTDANGNIKMTIQLTPNENGVATVAPGTKLEPMVLYAVFDIAK